MEDFKVYETFTRGNTDENEKINVEIYTHEELDEMTIQTINDMPFYKAERYMRSRKSKLIEKR